MDLAIIILSEVKSEKDKYHTILLIRGSLIFLNDVNELIYKIENRFTDFKHKTYSYQRGNWGGDKLDKLGVWD